MSLNRFLTVCTGVAAIMATSVGAQTVDQAVIDGLRWRNVGPANMSGRIADVEGLPSPSKTFFVAAAAGGVWKTTNNGVTFRPVFDKYPVASLGDLAIAPSDSNVLYLGSGEPNSRNSISPGGGIFKSTDGGLTWTFKGLTETQHIGRVIVHPTNPNIAWVAALGAAWTTNRERGLYKTTDGGETWVNKKYINDTTGFIDVDIHPRDPNVLFATSYHRLRGPYFLQSGGKGSALWKSTDGGESWTEVKGGGFPETMKGRMEIAIAQSNPDIMYVLVEADSAPNPKPAAGSKAQERKSGLYRSADGGKTWERTAKDNVRPFYYSQVRVHPKNPDRVWFSSTPVKVSDEGGKNARNSTIGLHVDHHAMWIDPVDPDRHVVGNDGGIGITYDNGGNYIFPNTFAIGQFYNVSFDMAVPYRVCGGLQDNGSWCGPSRRRQGAITNAMWFTFNGGDGFVTQQDPTNPDIIYGESQGGNIGRYQVSAGQRTALQKPNYRTQYMKWEDSIMTVRGDTARAETAAQRRAIAELRGKQKKDSVDMSLRWNWNTPFHLSPHNPSIVYMGANRVMKSMKRGDEMYPISPDLSYADTTKLRISTRTTGGITVDATGAETFGTIVSLNESPITPGYLYAGTDDGRLWMTENDGGAWTELTSRVGGVPAGTYVSRIEPSNFDINTFYVTYDNHRRGDFTPYVFATSDGGRSFRSIAGGLPRGGPDFVHVIREDLRNADLLFVGTDVGAYVSGDRGATWQKFMTDLPTVPVHDLKIHPRERELIAATHGRSIWIVDIAPLQQFTKTVAAAPAHLFEPRTATQFGEPPVGGESTGNQLFQAPSPQYGADIWYRLSKAGGPTRIVIQDAKGDTLQTLTGQGSAGLHKVSWNFNGRAAPRAALKGAALRDSILGARRTAAALDSVEKAGKVPKPALDMIRRNLEGGAQGMQAMARAFGFGGGGGGGGGGQPGVWVERPAEQAPAPVRAAGGAASGRAGGAGGPGGGGQGAGAAMGLEQSDLFDIMRAIGVTGGGGGGGFFGGANLTVAPGDYLISMTVGGETQKRTLRVERTVGGGASGFPFEVEAMMKAYERYMRDK
ncbi:MAG: WD40/YVTN/BNR-like repeat-containing protein [Gemmatimonadaceae bacterium]